MKFHAFISLCLNEKNLNFSPFFFKTLKRLLYIGKRFSLACLLWKTYFGARVSWGTPPAFDLLSAAVISLLGGAAQGVPGVLLDTSHTTVRPPSNLWA